MTEVVMVVGGMRVPVALVPAPLGSASQAIADVGSCLLTQRFRLYVRFDKAVNVCG